MDDGSEDGDYRGAAWVGLRPDPEHGRCDIFTRRIRDIYSSRLQKPRDPAARQLHALVRRHARCYTASSRPPLEAREKRWSHQTTIVG